MQINAQFPNLFQLIKTESASRIKRSFFEHLMETAKKEDELGMFSNDAAMVKSRTFRAVRGMSKNDVCALIDHIYSNHRVNKNTKYDALTMQRDYISDKGYARLIKDHFLIARNIREIKRIFDHGYVDLKFIIHNKRFNGSEKLVIALMLMAQDSCSMKTFEKDPSILIEALRQKHGLAEAPGYKIVENLYFAAYNPHTKTILLPPDHSKKDILHEFGHFLFLEKEFSEKFHKDLARLFLLSKRKDRDGVFFWEAVDDSNYICGPDAHGHPDSNIDEFFASTFMVFELHKEEFRENIKNKENPKLARWAARLEALFDKELGI